MTAVGWLPADAEELFGPEATAEESYDVLTVDVPPAAWITALETARDRLGCTYFDWLSAVDEPGTGFRVTAHVAALSPLRRLLLRTTVPHETPALPSAVGVYAGAAWHERETHEMFGIPFEGHPALDHLLLPDNFEGHPLRKDFVLAARVAKAWPGAKEPGESEHGGPKRRQMLPPGVPDPNEWGPLKGQLPPAPTRGAGRTAGDRPTRGTRPAGERPVRRARSVSEGSASQTATGPETPAGGAGSPSGGAEAPSGGAGAPSGGAGAPSGGASAGGAGASAGPRRTRSVSEGSASQVAAGAETPAGGAGASAGPRRTRSAAEGSASQSTPGGSTPPASADPRRNRSASQGSASEQRGGPASQVPGSASPATSPEAVRPGSTSPTSDAPWHHARPAFDEESSSSPEGPATPVSSGPPESLATPESSGTPESPDSTDPADAQDSATEPQPTDDHVKPAAGPSKPENLENPKNPKNAKNHENPDHPENPDNLDNPEDPAGGPQ
ncbi:NADH-quinone oxidoreductase subunit C [Streptomyces tuirus]|uniref:Dehydrogenase n=1 Tax=Streptomyces tuirus TaxID=68278 RepID=A0A7G1NGR7_9ACTN|nr:NADH-quinone oxidoreductase subunit C [Streptomyces tuirus]BCL22353.1 dehydrogenase [Streptomyces tuirus]